MRQEWGRFEFEETKIGRLEHKVEKLQIVKLVPGVEWLRPYGMSGDHGITMEEHTPFGVVAAISPVTHSVPTLSGNVINMVAAGNAVVFNPHPGGARSAALAVRAFNEAIHAALGIENLVCTIEKPTLEILRRLDKERTHPPALRHRRAGGRPAAMKCGKRAICAGPGNPPVLVDGTGCLKKAARDIIKGGAYDNNLLCIGEKQVFVLESFADAFMAALQAAGRGQAERRRSSRSSPPRPSPSRRTPAAARTPSSTGRWSGRTPPSWPGTPARACPPTTPILFAETDAEHPFVMEEQMMPMLPVVRVKNVERGHRVRRAIRARLQALRDHPFAQRRPHDRDGPGPGHDALRQERPEHRRPRPGRGGVLELFDRDDTGEGITSPKTFTRTRRCVMVDNLRIY